MPATVMRQGAGAFSGIGRWPPAIGFFPAALAGVAAVPAAFIDHPQVGKKRGRVLSNRAGETQLRRSVRAGFQCRHLSTGRRLSRRIFCSVENPDVKMSCVVLLFPADCRLSPLSWRSRTISRYRPANRSEACITTMVFLH